MKNFLELQLEGQLPKPGKTGVDWYLFYTLARQFAGKPMLECGTGYGGSALTLYSLSDQLTVIDDWCQGYSRQPFEELIRRYNLLIDYRVENTHTAIPRLDKQYWFVHLDANKKYHKVLTDLQQIQSKCNGIICVDDYMNSMWPEVTWAVDEFVRSSDWNISLIGNHQIFIAKNRQMLLIPTIDLPLAMSDNSMYLTYGQFPDDAVQFISSGIMKYSWHDIQILPAEDIP
jgi:predicted O-methyltransferase YrrM